jgi:hypothetical protein
VCAPPVRTDRCLSRYSKLLGIVHKIAPQQPYDRIPVGSQFAAQLLAQLLTLMPGHCFPFFNQRLRDIPARHSFRWCNVRTKSIRNATADMVTERHEQSLLRNQRRGFFAAQRVCDQPGRKKPRELELAGLNQSRASKSGGITAEAYASGQRIEPGTRRRGCRE